MVCNYMLRAFKQLHSLRWIVCSYFPFTELKIGSFDFNWKLSQCCNAFRKTTGIRGHINLHGGKKQLCDGRDVHIFHFTIPTKIVWDTFFALAFFVKLKGHSFEIIFEVSRLILLIYRSLSAGKIWKFYNLNKLISLNISLQRGMTTSGLNCWQRVASSLMYQFTL